MSTLTASHGLTLSNTGLKLIKAYEGYRPVDRVLVSGQRVVGYGHRLYDDKPRQLSKADAEALLISDLRAYEDMINENVYAPLTQGQFDALVSFAFNIGPKAFLASETLHAMNNGRPLDAANALDVWRKSTINGKTYIIDALMRRRTAEKALFLRTESFPCPASGIDLPPVKDESLASIVLEKDFPVYEQKQTSGIVATAPFTLDELAESRSETAGDAAIDKDAALDLEDFELNNQLNDGPNRRRDDGPAGVLMLSEVAEAPIIKGPLIDEDALLEENHETLDAIDLKDDPLVEDQIPVDDESILTLDQISDEDATIGSLVETETDIAIASTLETLGTLENEELSEISQTIDDKLDVNRSVIAEAAADISERLDALIEDAKDPNKEMDWPDNIVDPEALTDTTSTMDTLNENVSNLSEDDPVLLSEVIDEPAEVLSLSSGEQLENNDVENGSAKDSDDKVQIETDVQIEEIVYDNVLVKDNSNETTNLNDEDEDTNVVGEPEASPAEGEGISDTLSANLSDDIEVEALETNHIEDSARTPDPSKADIIIDNLAEDDAMRDHNDDMSVFYERHNLTKPEPETTNIGFWMIMLSGFVLLGVTLAISLRGAEAVMGAWGPLVVIAGVLIGALMVVGAAYYAIRHALSYN